MRLKRNYEEFVEIVNSRGLQMFIGEKRADYYNLLAIDGDTVYECNIQKIESQERSDFELNHLPLLTERVVDKPSWDELITTFPSTLTELHTYKRKNIVVQTVLITYTDSSRKRMASIQKTRLGQ